MVFSAPPPRAQARRLRPRRAIPCRARPRASGGLADPLRPFSRRRKNRPTPVLRLKRRRRVGRGDHASLPRETAVGQLSGHAVVEAVVRRLTDGDQIPAAPLPAWVVLNRIDMVSRRGRFDAAKASGLAAFKLVAPQHRVSQMLPAPAFVIHGKTKAPRPQRESWRGWLPAITSEQTKSAKRLTAHAVKSFGAGSRSLALALAHIHVYQAFASAQLAVQRKVGQRCCLSDALLRRPTTQWADQLALC